MTRPRFLGSEGDPECIFFTLNTYQATLLVTFFDMTVGIGTSFGKNKRMDGGVWRKDRKMWKFEKLSKCGMDENIAGIDCHKKFDPSPKIRSL